MTYTLGIDIGGSGIKGAPVDLETGTLTQERVRIETPQPSTVEGVALTVRKLVEAFPEVEGTIGCTFPAIVQHGVIRSAANVDDSWIDVHAASVFSEWTERKVRVVNDADAAGLAEATAGAAVDQPGVVLVITLGTGVGSALIHNGILVPNTELGHLEIGGVVAETFASSRSRKDRGLDFEQWADDLNRYFEHVDRLFSPDLIVIGGGVSKRFDQFGHLLESQAGIVPAALRNDAGIVGAALWAGLNR